MMASDDFGELRSLLQRPPSRVRFHDVLGLFDEFSQAQREQRMLYALQQLERWPDAVRACPQERLEELENDEVVWAPLVRHLDYEHQYLNDRRFNKLLDNQHLRHITNLNLKASRFSWDNLLALAKRAPFERLEGFAMRKSSSSGADKTAIEELFHSKMLAELRHLSFEGWSGIKPYVYTLTANAPFLGTLESLDLSGCKVSLKRFKELVSSTELKNLESFRMTYQNQNASMGRMRALAEATHLTSLRELDFADFEPGELVALSRAEHLGGLRSLRLALIDSLSAEDPDMDDDAIITFCQTSVITQLESLALDMNLLERATLETLVRAPAMQSLRYLSIRSRAYTNWGLHRPDGPEYKGHLAALCASDLLSRLRSLHLHNLAMAPDELRSLVCSGHVASLEELSLGEHAFSEEHVAALLESAHLDKLHTLLITNVALSIEGFLELVSAENLTGLRELRLPRIRWKNHGDDQTIAQMIEANEMPGRTLFSPLRSGWSVLLQP